jgi:hypothetical protein
MNSFNGHIESNEKIEGRMYGISRASGKYHTSKKRSSATDRHPLFRRMPILLFAKRDFVQRRHEILVNDDCALRAKNGAQGIKQIGRAVDLVVRSQQNDILFVGDMKRDDIIALA